MGKVKHQPRVCLPYTFQQVCILWNINCNLSSYRTEDEIRPGAYYDPRLLPDYGGPCFDHREARLKQLDIHDEEKKLIPPWKLYDALKPGTIILADISLHCYIYPKKTPNEDGRKVFNECCQLKDVDLIFRPQIYQITAHKIQIMDKSDQAVEPRSVPRLPAGDTDDNENTKGKERDDLLTSFSTKKKMRMDTE